MRFTSFYALTISLLLVIFPAVSPAAPSTNSASKAALDATRLVDSSERSTHFAAVNNQLELGGVLYGYMDVDGDIEALGTSLTQLTERIATVQPMAAMAKQDYVQIFDTLGFSDIKAVGVSSVRVGVGFRNRAYFYTPNGRHGLLMAFGGPAQTFAGTKLAPPDTDFYYETEIDVPAAYNTLKEVVTKVAGEPMANSLEFQLKKAAPGEVKPLDVILSLSGHYTAFARIDIDDNIQLPGPQAITLPGVSFLIKADGIGSAIADQIAKGSFTRIEDNGRTFFQITAPVLGSKLHPAFLIEGNALLIGSSRAFIVECLTRTAGLDQQAAFKTALASVGPSGNGLFYVTPKLFATLRATLDDISASSPEAAAITSTWANSIPKISKPLVSVRINQPDGILINSYSIESYKRELILMSVYNPVTIGLLASMAIPAFQKVRTNSQEKMIQNNLRQFGAAAQQYMLETGKATVAYDDIVGPDKLITELKPVLGENYRAIIVHSTDKSVSVRTPKGQVFRAPL